MPKVTVRVPADLKARMDRYRDRFDWSGAARGGWAALIEAEEEREAERAAWEARKADLRQLWKDEDEGKGHG